MYVSSVLQRIERALLQEMSPKWNMDQQLSGDLPLQREPQGATERKKERMGERGSKQVENYPPFSPFN